MNTIAKISCQKRTEAITEAASTGSLGTMNGPCMYSPVSPSATIEVTIAQWVTRTGTSQT